MLIADAPPIGNAPPIEDEAVPDAAALAQAKAYARVDGAADDALIAGLVATACALCERFVGQVLVERGVAETVTIGVGTIGAGRTRLRRGPVRAITSVVLLAEAGEAIVPAGDYGIEIDGQGDGWVRYGGASFPHGAAGRSARLRVTYRAGLAADWARLPDPIAQGAVRLAAHLYAHRDAGDANAGVPPAAVAALWRPYRRMRLS